VSTRHWWVRPVRGVLLSAACTASVDAAWRLCREPLAALLVPLRDRGPRGLAVLPLDTVLVGSCAGLLLGCLLWLLAVAAIVLTSSVARELSPRGRLAAPLARLEARSCPTLVRHLVTAALGLAMTAGVAGPVAADPSGAGRLDGLAVPDRTSGAVPAGPAHGAVSPPPTRTVEVRPGDSLWSMATHLLPAGATDRQVTDAWRRLFRANTARVGPDPDLILPGTRLVVPDLHEHHRKEAP
jgi:hypothetical protein